MNFRHWTTSCPAPDSAILIALTALTRIAFRSRFLYDIDSINFALALQRFDPSVHQPHPPGYFLYVCLGVLSHSIFRDANTALVAVSILASCGTVAVIHLLASVWFGRMAAACAGLIFVTSPIAWFHGTVALTYIVEAFFSIALGYLCWRVYDGAHHFVIPAAVVLGLAAGFRQSSLVILLPLLLLAFHRVPRRLVFQGIGALGLVLMAWLMPMLYTVGGVHAYTSVLWALWRLVPARQTIFTASIFTTLARGGLIAAIYALCFGVAALLPLRASTPVSKSIRTFTWMWLAPGLLLFTFVYLKFVNSGYLMVLLPPVCIWLGFWAADWYRHARLPVAARIAVLAGAAAVNVAVFLRVPLYFSYQEVRSSQRQLTAALDAVRQVSGHTGGPQETVIVGFDSHFLGYRHAGYYLPEFLTIQFPEVPLASTTGVFVMQHQDTRLVSRLRMRPFRTFILFPLPSSDREYRDYMQRIRARFPPGVLQTNTENGLEILTGPVSALSVLFPHAVLE